MDDDNRGVEMLGIVLLALYGYVLGAATVGLIWWIS
jgi:hypothetical protein